MCNPDAQYISLKFGDKGYLLQDNEADISLPLSKLVLSHYSNFRIILHTLIQQAATSLHKRPAVQERSTNVVIHHSPKWMGELKRLKEEIG